MVYTSISVTSILILQESTSNYNDYQKGTIEILCFQKKQDQDYCQGPIFFYINIFLKSAYCFMLFL